MKSGKSRYMDIMKFCQKNVFGRFLQGLVQHYNHDKYWRRRYIVTNPDNTAHILIKLFYLWYIKRCDAFNNCSFGTNLNSGAFFAEPPCLPYGFEVFFLGLYVFFGVGWIVYREVIVMWGGG